MESLTFEMHLTGRRCLAIRVSAIEAFTESESLV